MMFSLLIRFFLLLSFMFGIIFSSGCSNHHEKDFVLALIDYIESNHIYDNWVETRNLEVGEYEIVDTKVTSFIVDEFDKKNIENGSPVNIEGRLKGYSLLRKSGSQEERKVFFNGNAMFLISRENEGFKIAMFVIPTSNSPF